MSQPAVLRKLLVALSRNVVMVDAQVCNSNTSADRQLNAPTCRHLMRCANAVVLVQPLLRVALM